MLDIPGKTSELIAQLAEATPFRVSPTPEIRASFASRDPPLIVPATAMVSKISYADNAGGILCFIELEGGKNVVGLSLTHLRVSSNEPFARAVAAYQKHRIKKIKKQDHGGPRTVTAQFNR